ncbi:MAG: hypothetical protein PHF86_04215 [Candidatus Nanoarchaeia archaeon]|nr:hypothetical protein [Candidatus Nanoarchaeia archaeon]
MATLNGIVIADPARKNQNFSNVERDQFDVTRKYPGEPLPQFVSEQDTFNNFQREYPTARGGYTINETTIPMTLTLNNDMLNLWRTRKRNLLADVEKPQLEADKYLVDQGMNLGAWFDPKAVNPEATFKTTVRPMLRTIRDPASRYANAHIYAKFIHYLYKQTSGTFQDVYYKDNPRKDSKGRIHLFDRPFTRIWA